MLAFGRRYGLVRCSRFVCDKHAVPDMPEEKDAAIRQFAGHAAAKHPC